jgi:predicted permease
VLQRLFLELVPCLLAGLLLGSVFPGLPARLAPPLITWGVPISLAGLLLRSGLRGELLMAGLMGLLGPGLTLLLLRLPPLQRLIPGGSLQLGSAVGNTAYWGLPVALALLPPEAIGHTITYDLVGTLLTWSVGPLLVQGIPARPRALLETLRTSPASRGLVMALLLQLTPWSATIAAVLWWPARLLILLALSLVGMRLGVMLRCSSPSASPVPELMLGLGPALAAKLLVAPVLMLLLAGLFRLPLVARDAVVLQAAAPTAISVLLLTESAWARTSENQPPTGQVEAAAGLVLWSTLFALLTVPLWWWLLRGPLAG